MATGAHGGEPDLTTRELYRASTLATREYSEEYGRDVLQRSWGFGRPDRGNFTFFSDSVEELTVTETGSLRFTLGEQKVVLGWGNYVGKQPLSERAWIPWERTLEMKVRQSTEEVTTWGFHLWIDGQRFPRSSTALLHGSQSKHLQFAFGRLRQERNDYKLIVPDGVEIQISGEPGTEIEIESLGFFRKVRRGGFRKVIDLGEKRVWRGVATVSLWCRLFVNGQEVELENSVHRRPSHAMIAVDLKPFLRRGRNCLAILGERHRDHPTVYVQGQVVFEDGEAVRLDTGSTWREGPIPLPRGWQDVDFDDSSWKPARSLTALPLSQPIPIPSYDGRLVLENPDDRMLVFDATEPVRARVRVPPGLGKERGAVHWLLDRIDFEGEHPQGKGTAEMGNLAEGSLVYQVDCGRLPRGVYALALSLRSGDRIIESRPREPIVVTGRVPMKEVNGKSVQDGMKLTLEDTIDFTDPDDPHPWIEGFKENSRAETQPVEEPKLVRKEGMVYRETGPGRGSYFSYRIEFKHPGDFYLMLLDYPNDAERWIGVSTSTTENGPWTQSKAGPSIWTGDKYPLSRTLQEHHWIYRADFGPHTIDLISMQEGSPAAASRLRIYHIDELPALKVKDRGRGLGILTERTNMTSSFGKTLGINRFELTRLGREPMEAEQMRARPMRQRLHWLVRTHDACEHYARYLRYTGQNMHAMGCFQYSEANTPFGPAAGFDSRVPWDLRDLAVRVLGYNGIDVIASIEYSGHRSLARNYFYSDAQVAAGADTPRAVTRDGSQLPGRIAGAYGCWNFVHPRVQQLMKRVASDVLAKFRDRPNFRGLNWTSYMTGEWLPNFPDEDEGGPFATSYDDATVRTFESDTGLRVPIRGDDPERFRKRHLYLTSEGLRPKLVDWRCRKVRETFLSIRDTVKAGRADLDLFVSLYFNVPHAREWSLASLPGARLEGRDGLRQFMRPCGYDPILYRDDPGLWLTRWTHATVKYAPMTHEHAYAAAWRQNVDDEFVRLYERPTNRSVMIMHHWDENHYRAPGTVAADPEGRTWEFPDSSHPEWVVPFNRGRLHAQPNGDSGREAFTQALITSDPELVMFGFVDVNLLVGNEQALRDFARGFRSLPRKQFRPALGTSLQTDLAIRELSTDEGFFMTVANPTPWPITGEITLGGAGTVTDLASGDRVASASPEGGTRVPVGLKSFGVAAFHTRERGAKAVSWTTSAPAASHLAHLNVLLGRTEGLLGRARARSALEAEDAAFLQRAWEAARSAVESRRYALAWDTLTHWRVWTLLQELEGAKLMPAKAPSRSIIYEPDTRRLILWDSEESAPFTPADLLQAEQREKWGVVEYDKATDTTRLSAHLVVGKKDGTSTYLQLGRPDHLAEILVVKGNVRVSATPLQSPVQEKRSRIANRLRLGDPHKPEVRAALKFDNSGGSDFGIKLGVLVKRKGQNHWDRGGSLHVYHSTVTALRQDWDHAVGTCNLVGAEVHLVGSTMSWCRKIAGYGIPGAAARRLEGTTFDHCNTALYNGLQKAADCVFRNCGVAVQEGGCLSGTFTRCTFQDNGANFTKSRPGDLLLIDCNVGPQRQPLRFRKGEDPQTGAPSYPQMISARSLVVTVEDEGGKPVPGAIVDIVCEQADRTTVVRGFAVTDRNGSTPGTRSPDRLLLTENRLTATDARDNPSSATFSYRARVAASGFQEKFVDGITPNAGLHLRVVLRRQKTPQ